MDEPNWTKVLLETPSGFALFAVNDIALEETDVPIQFFSILTLVLSFPSSFGPCN
jgi:hypothetical protein